MLLIYWLNAPGAVLVAIRYRDKYGNLGKIASAENSLASENKMPGKAKSLQLHEIAPTNLGESGPIHQPQALTTHGFKVRPFAAPVAQCMDKWGLLPVKTWYLVPADGDVFL